SCSQEKSAAGGFEDMVALIASYLFDHPEYMYSPRAAPTESSWTRSPVAGNRLADKSAYVLTSSLRSQPSDSQPREPKALRWARRLLFGIKTGTVKKKWLPFCGPLVTQILPPCLVTNSLAMYKPSPMPLRPAVSVTVA